MIKVATKRIKANSQFESAFEENLPDTNLFGGVVFRQCQTGKIQSQDNREKLKSRKSSHDLKRQFFFHFFLQE